MLLQHLLACPFCIYGAGIVATGVYTAIKTLYHTEPLFFLVSDLENQGESSKRTPTEVDGIAVKSLSAWDRELQTDMSGFVLPKYYLIATPQIHHSAITASLHSMENLHIEDTQIILFTNELENELFEAYYCSLAGHTTILSLMAGKKMEEISEDGNCCRKNHAETYIKKLKAAFLEIHVYQAKSHMDKTLYDHSTQFDNKSGHSHQISKHLRDKCTDFKTFSYIYPIQVGAVLTEQVITDLQDGQGDNISLKNRNYCELTATYYAWKHSLAAYKGICHYRRIFDISDEQMQKLLEMEREWDVILPYPSIHYPNISTQHLRYVNEDDWNAMLRALEETAPEYLEAYEKYIAAGGQFFFNFNMLIAKAQVFNDYCSFLFRVLERTEELTTPKGWERADRFAGYLGENLTTLYFLKNRDKLKIVYAGKLWLT